MVLKILGRDWTCNMQCGANCCSEIFLPLNKAQMESIIKDRFWIVDHDYTDFKWLGYHKVFKIINTGDKGTRRIELAQGVEYEFKKHPMIECHTMIYIQDKCVMLLPNNRCKAFRSRPNICKKAECVVFGRDKIQWYGENGVLADKVKAYKEGKLQKW